MSRLLCTVLSLAAVALAGCASGSGAVATPHTAAAPGLSTSVAFQRAGSAVVAPRAHSRLAPAASAGPSTPLVPQAPAPPQGEEESVLAAGAPGPIVALGDSITYGYGTGAGTAPYGPPPSHSYPWYLARDLHIPVVNAGVSGTTAYGLLDPTDPEDSRRPASLQLPALLGVHPRLIVVGFGSNEAVRGWPIRETAHHLDLVLGRIADAHVPAVLLGTHVDCFTMPCPTRPGAFRQRYTDQWDAALEWLAAKYGIPAVLNVESGFSPEDLTDWIHPSSAGYSVIARRVEPPVLRALAGERRSAPPPAEASATPAAPAAERDGQVEGQEPRRDPPRPQSVWDGDWGGRSYLSLPLLDILRQDLAIITGSGG